MLQRYETYTNIVNMNKKLFESSINFYLRVIRFSITSCTKLDDIEHFRLGITFRNEK